jgi:mono/diheme cytochrome c family protein
MNTMLLRRIAAAAAILATALVLAACGSDNDSGPSDAQVDDAATTTATAPATTTSEAQTTTEETTEQASADGKAIFTENCAGCHTLADAGASGEVGPNLDDAKPEKDAVVTMVSAGKGAMPSFQGQLSEDEIEAVAEYVSSSAG